MSIDPNHERYMEQARRIDAARRQFDAVTLAALTELESLDPELARAALALFRNRREAAHWFAYGLNGTDDTSAYAALANGQRDLIHHALLRVEHGIF